MTLVIRIASFVIPSEAKNLHEHGAPMEIPRRARDDRSTGRAWRAVIMAVLAVSAGIASAQSFPSKPVRIVSPFPPGGGTDTLARLIAPGLSETWGQQVIVENKPGASGHIGAELVARSAADGHTLVMASTATLDEKNVVEFAPVSLVSATPYVIAANPRVPARNVRELIALAKAQPGKLTFGSSGAGAASHLSAELFKAMAGVDLLHVPYKGVGQALTDLVAGHVDLLFAAGQQVMPYVQGGRLKALAITSAKRSELLPDLPTVAESGVPGYEAVGWFGLLAPAATPKPVVERISADVNRVLARRELLDKAHSLGSEISGTTPDEFARFIRADQSKWAKLMQEKGIKAE